MGSQQMNVEGVAPMADLVFRDMGAVTAEEVNVVPLADLLDLSVVENFGWGTDGQTKDGEAFAREGTWAVGDGIGLEFGGPPCIGDLTDAEMSDMIQPYIQYGRSSGHMLFGITSSVMNSPSFNKIKLLSTEYNTASLIGTTEAHDPALGPRPVNFVGLYLAGIGENLSPVPITGGFNFLVQSLLNVDAAVSRADARLFKFPDGTAGAFIERTGEIWALQEFSLDELSSPPEVVVPPVIPNLVIPPPSPPPTELSSPHLSTHGTGCPKTFTAGTAYAPGDLVSAAHTVYRCAAAPTNLFCGLIGFAPGQEQYWETAWTALGPCPGTQAAPVVPTNPLVPATSPVPAVPATSPGANTDCSNDRNICEDGLTCLHSGVNGSDRWSCGQPQAVSATPPATSPVPATPVVPVASPVNYVAPLVPPGTPNLGGCPGAWTVNGAYGAGARVAKNNVVYQCKGTIMGLHCPKAGYEPGVVWGRLDYWTLAWDVAGTCGN